MIQINFLQINEIINQPCHLVPERKEIVFIKHQQIVRNYQMLQKYYFLSMALKRGRGKGEWGKERLINNMLMGK